MEFDDLCIEKTQAVGHLVAAFKDLCYVAKLWKRRPDFMENVKQFIITMKVVARNLCVLSVVFVLLHVTQVISQPVPPEHH